MSADRNGLMSEDQVMIATAVYRVLNCAAADTLTPSQARVVVKEVLDAADCVLIKRRIGAMHAKNDAYAFGTTGQSRKTVPGK